MRQISDLHPSFMAIQYSILFSFGEDGFRIDISYRKSSHRHSNIRQYVTTREFYAYRIQQRINEGRTLIKGERLFLKYIVDAFSCVKEERLDYIKRNQKDLWSKIYQGIRDALVHSDIDNQLKEHLEKQILHLPHSYITNFHGFCNLLLFYYLGTFY